MADRDEIVEIANEKQGENTMRLIRRRAQKPRENGARTIRSIATRLKGHGMRIIKRNSETLFLGGPTEFLSKITTLG